MNIFEEVHYTSFDKMYADLLPNGKYGLRWRSLYRGVSSASYPLLPTRLRNLSEKQICGGESLMHMYEHTDLLNFYNEANKQGLQLPTSKKLHSMMMGDIFIVPHTIVSWYPQEMEELAALAQHYGILTRMLDWTLDLHAALYFAAVNACRAIKDGRYKDTSIAIWRLEPFSYQSELNELGLKILIPSYFTNPNLAAQKGVMTYMKVPYSNYQVDTTPLEIKISSMDCKVHGNKPVLHKFTLQADQSLYCLRFLTLLGYSAAMFFPGYAGVVKYLEENNFDQDEAVLAYQSTPST